MGYSQSNSPFLKQKGGGTTKACLPLSKIRSMSKAERDKVIRAKRKAGKAAQIDEMRDMAGFATAKEIERQAARDKMRYEMGDTKLSAEASARERYFLRSDKAKATRQEATSLHISMNCSSLISKSVSEYSFFI